MIKKWTAAFLLLVLAMNFCSCGKQPEVLSPEPGNTGHTTPEPIPVVYTHSVLDAQYPQYAPMPDMDDYMHNGTLDDEAYDDAYDIEPGVRLHHHDDADCDHSETDQHISTFLP